MNQARLVTVPKRASPPAPTAPWHYSPGQQTDGPAAVLVAFANGWGSSGTQGLQSTASAPAARGCLVLIFKGIILSLWNEVLHEEAPGFLCLC